MRHKIHFIIFPVVLLLSLGGCDKNIPPEPDPNAGIVRDYSGQDGCEWVILMNSGEELVPVVMTDTSFHFYDGQHVEVWYTELDSVVTACMAGKAVRIDSIRNATCQGLKKWSKKLPKDDFGVDSVFIYDDCLVVRVNYGGGCKHHDFFLSLLPTMGPLNTLTLSHDSHGDLCEAFIHEPRAFDITSLQSPGSHSVTFILTLNIPGSAYRKEITYHY